MTVYSTSNIYEIFIKKTTETIEKIKDDYNFSIGLKEEHIKNNLEEIKDNEETILFWASKRDIKFVNHFKKINEELEKQIPKYKQSIIDLTKERDRNLKIWENALKEYEEKDRAEKERWKALTGK